LALDNHFLFARKFDATLGSFILDELDKKIATNPFNKKQLAIKRKRSFKTEYSLRNKI